MRLMVMGTTYNRERRARQLILIVDQIRRCPMCGAQLPCDGGKGPWRRVTQASPSHVGPEASDPNQGSRAAAPPGWLVRIIARRHRGKCPPDATSRGGRNTRIMSPLS